MRVDREYAHSVVAARKRMRTVWAGQGILVIPFQAGSAYHSTHYVPELRNSVQCTGEGSCPYHHLVQIQKMHMPCLVHCRIMRYDEAAAFRAEADPEFVPARWMKQVVEVTEGCFDQAEKRQPEGTPAIISRKPGKKNNPLEFRWLEDINVSVPPEHRYDIDTAMPLVIDKVYRTGRCGVGVDNPPELGTKHNSNTKSNDYADGIGGAV